MPAVGSHPISAVVRALEGLGNAILAQQAERTRPDLDHLQRELFRYAHLTLLHHLTSSSFGQTAGYDRAIQPSRVPSGCSPQPFLTPIANALRAWIAEDRRPERLGALHEALLAYQPVLGSAGMSLVPGTGRRRTGSFYTPPILIDETITRALDPVIQGHLSGDAAEAALLSLRICDPAAGGGYFLLAAARAVGLALAVVRAKGNRPDGQTRAKARADVIQHCLTGFDRDPLAVEICRNALSIEAGGLSSSVLSRQIVCVDSLLAERSLTEIAGVSGFDVILGNPPYGLIADRTERQQVTHRFPTARTSGNAAIAFLELALRLLRPGGQLGLVVPRSLTYSSEWSAIRRAILPGLTSLTVVGHGFDGVKLEQVIISAGRQPADRTVYREIGALLNTENTAPVGACSFRPARGPDSTTIDTEVWRRTDTWSAPPTAIEARILARVTGLPCLGALTFIARGIGLPTARQAVSPSPVRSPNPPTAPLYGGAEIGVLQLLPARATVDRCALPASSGRLLVPKVLTQNIVGHVKRPRPHVWLKAAIDPNGEALPLDTVNWIVPTTDQIGLREIAVLINSRFASWYASRFIFAGAQRTMHLDSPYLGRLPVPDLRDALANQDHADLASRIDRIVYDALGLDAEAIGEIDSTFH